MLVARNSNESDGRCQIAERRIAGSRMADFPGAVTRHLIFVPDGRDLEPESAFPQPGTRCFHFHFWSAYIPSRDSASNNVLFAGSASSSSIRAFDEIRTNICSFFWFSP